MNRTGLTDLALAPLAGLRTGTTLMEPVGAKRYQLQSQADGEREDAVRPGAPYALAADKTADLLGVNHPAVLRRRTTRGPAAARLATGGTMSLIADDMMTPARGCSAPNRAYPPSTHVRGLVGHLVFGFGVAATTGLGWKPLGRRP